jgi:hypothetical protein
MTIFHQTFLTKHALATAAVVFAGTCVPAVAHSSMQSMQTMQSGPSMQSPQLTLMDRSFVTDMLQETRAQQRFAQLARQRASSVATVRAANAIYGEWTTLRGQLTGLALAGAAPVRGALTASQQAELWNLGRTPKAGFDRAYLREAQLGNDVAFSRIRNEDASSNLQIQQFLDEARPLINGYQAMLTADIGRLPPTAQLPMNGLIGPIVQ